jgi:hypothetical protein
VDLPRTPAIKARRYSGDMGFCRELTGFDMSEVNGFVFLAGFSSSKVMAK